MSDQSPVRIIWLTKTCDAVPAQWEGETDAGAAVYIRYRYGTLRVHIGPGVHEAIDREPIFVWESDDEWDGCMDEGRLRSLLPDWLTIAGASQRRLTPA